MANYGLDGYTIIYEFKSRFSSTDIFPTVPWLNYREKALTRIFVLDQVKRFQRANVKRFLSIYITYVQKI